MEQIHTDRRPEGLRVDLKRHPWGLPPSATAWRFSWQPPAGVQTAYRLRLYRGIPNTAEPYLATAWVEDGCFTGRRLPVEWQPSLPTGLYSWQVQVRGGDGVPSAWSEPQPFTILDSASWQESVGVWLPPTRVAGEHPGVCGFVRQSFSLSEEELSRSAAVTVSVTARSPEPSRQYVCTLFCNGYPLLVAPPRYGRDPQGRRLLFVQTVEATPYLRAGENVISAILTCPAASDVRMFACRATAYTRTGEGRKLLSPQGWRGLDGEAALRPRESIGTGYFTAYGQNIDGTAYPFGFDLPGFDDTGWDDCPACGRLSAGLSEGEELILTAAGCDPVSRYPQELPPRVRMLGRGHYLVDLGQEIIGSLSLCVPPASAWTQDPAGGVEVAVCAGEQLRPAPTEDGRLVKWDMNTGNHYAFSWRLVPGETFTSTDMLTLRFVELEGLPFELTSEMLTGVAIRRDFVEEASAMTCSSPLLCELWRLTRNTIKYTTQDMYVDSQSRERGAYEGDALINQLAAYCFENDYATARFSLEYLYGHRTWPAEYILWICEAAWEDYMATGDDASLSRWYPVLKQKTFTAYLDPESGLLYSGNTAASGTDAVLVDWPPSERDGYDMAVKYNTVLNCAAVAGYTALSNIAAVVGEETDAKDFSARADALREAILTRLYDPAVGDFSDGLYEDGTPSPHVSQHTAAYALYAGVYRDSAEADVIAARLWERSLGARDGSRIRMSVYGTYFLLMGLYRSGHGDMANSLLADEDDTSGHRTYAYMLRRAVGEAPSPFDGRPIGATLTTEAWCTRSKPNMTFSHPWGAAAAVAILRGVFGLHPTAPGWASYASAPQAAGVAWGRLTCPTAAGTITAELP